MVNSVPSYEWPGETPTLSQHNYTDNGEELVWVYPSTLTEERWYRNDVCNGDWTMYWGGSENAITVANFQFMHNESPFNITVDETGTYFSRTNGSIKTLINVVEDDLSLSLTWTTSNNVIIIFTRIK